ncbi:hypothetical protein A6U86_08065 [Rhizobium sp. AC27/96]|nr:hypothetical protein A6U86_08065 [Rhizobium sp. AC27/96]
MIRSSLSADLTVIDRRHVELGLPLMGHAPNEVEIHKIALTTTAGVVSGANCIDASDLQSDSETKRLDCNNGAIQPAVQVRYHDAQIH